MHHQLKIRLTDIAPPIWRRVLVPSELTLFGLHEVIQIVMGWQDCHLHDFTIKGKRYAVPSPDDFDDPIDETQIRLREVIGPRDNFIYQYDFGDGWDHAIRVEKVVDDTDAPGPVCVDGERACPPEDSGGPWGYVEKLQALARPDDKETKELREWIGVDFDPDAFDRTLVNKELQRAFRLARGKRRRIQ